VNIEEVRGTVAMKAVRGEWRHEMRQDRLARLMAEGVVEKMIASGRLPHDIPFQLAIGSWGSALERSRDLRLIWSQAGEKDGIHAFSARVKRVAAALGSPVEVTSSQAYTPTSPPNLHARWELSIDDKRKLIVNVMSLWPRGCKINPLVIPTEHVIYASLHPECEAVLATLEDL